MAIRWMCIPFFSLLIITAVALVPSIVEAKQLPRNSVGTKQIKNKAITSAKIRNKSVTSAKVSSRGAAFGQTLTALGNGKAAWAPTPHYFRTIVVSPILVNGVPDAVQSGTALINALSSITGASATDPYLLKVEPGIYDLGIQSLIMPPYVDLEGSGEGVTTILSAFNAIQMNGVITGAAHSELRYLTVENTAGNGVATQVRGISCAQSAVGCNIQHVTVNVTGGADVVTGILYNAAVTGIISDVTVNAVGTGAAAVSQGMVFSSSDVQVINSSIFADNSSGATGIFVTGPATKFEMSNSTVTSNVTGAGGGATGVSLTDGGVIRSSDIRATNGNLVVGVVTGGVLNTGTFRMEGTHVSAIGGAVSNKGVAVGGGTSVTIVGSIVEGMTNSIITFVGTPAVNIGLSQLIGPANQGTAASLVCGNVINGAFTPLAATCL